MQWCLAWSSSFRGRFVNPDFRLLRASVRNRQVQATLIMSKKRCPRPSGGWNTSQSFQRHRLLRVERIDEAFPTHHIQTLARCVVEHVVRVSDDIEGTGLLAT